MLCKIISLSVAVVKDLSKKNEKNVAKFFSPKRRSFSPMASSRSPVASKNPARLGVIFLLRKSDIASSCFAALWSQ